MFTSLALVASTLLFSLAQGAALPEPSTPWEKPHVVARAGPSGYVVYPPGDTTLLNAGGNDPNSAGGVNYLVIQYQGVYETSPKWAETIGVDIYLEDPSGNQPDQPMAYNFGNPGAGALIEGFFSPPKDACGTYRLVFIEHQYYGDTVISFRAAAPTLTINCVPLQRK